MSDDSPVWSGEPVLCRSDYYADTGRHRERGDRAVRCNLFAGHVVDHDELVDDVPGIVTWPLRPSRPAIAEERDRLSGEEVRRLRQELDEARAERDRLCADHTRFVQRMLGVDYALRKLVALKDGPRDEAYERDKPSAWQQARDALAAVDTFRSATPDAEPAPRVWHLPPEPGLEVTRVLDAYGQYFERQHDEHPGDDVWIGQTFAGDVDVDDLMLEWPLLMAYHAPITDATPAPGVPVDTEATP